MRAVYFKRISEEEKTAFKFSWLNFFIAIERGVGIALMIYFTQCAFFGYQLQRDIIKRDIVLAELKLKQYSHCEIKRKSKRH